MPSHGPERKIPWGAPVPYPTEDILAYLKPYRSRFGLVVADLGCGTFRAAVDLQGKLRCTLFANDIAEDIISSAKEFDRTTDDYDEVPIFPMAGDITSLDNFLVLHGKILRKISGESEGLFDAIIANNLFTNLTKDPADPFIVATSIWYGLKPNGFVFILDHLRKDRGPFGSPTIHKEYQRRYQEAVNQGRLEGDVWTSSPPRWVHHYDFRELLALFPPNHFARQKFEIRPYVGDSANATNSFYLVAQKKCH